MIALNKIENGLFLRRIKRKPLLTYVIKKTTEDHVTRVARREFSKRRDSFQEWTRSTHDAGRLSQFELCPESFAVEILSSFTPNTTSP